LGYCPFLKKSFVILLSGIDQKAQTLHQKTIKVVFVPSNISFGLRSKKHRKLSNMTTTEEESVNSLDVEDQDRRRKRAYKWYKHYAKPTKVRMGSIIDYYGNDIDITRQDVDLLPWNPEETEVIKEAMKFPKKEKAAKKDKKKDKKKVKKEKERTEDIAFVESKGSNPTPLNGQMSDSSTSLDISSQNGSSGSLEYRSTSSWDQDPAQDHQISAEQLRTIKVEEEHKRKREERRRKREEVTKNMPEKELQEKITVEDTRREDTRSKIVTARHEDRLDRTFLWYMRMGTPSLKEFKRQIATQKVDITPEDVELLPWNETGTRVMNIATMNSMITARMLKQSAAHLPAAYW
jgi:hypothetical protein